MRALAGILILFTVIHAQATPGVSAFIADVEFGTVRHRALLHVSETAPQAASALTNPAAAAEHVGISRRQLQVAVAPWSDPDAMMDHGQNIDFGTSGTIEQQAAEDAIRAAVNTRNRDPSEPSWSQPNLAIGTSIGDSSATNEQDASEQQIDSIQGAGNKKQSSTPAWSDAYDETDHAQDAVTDDTTDSFDMAAEDTVEDQVSSATATDTVSYTSLLGQRRGRRIL